jgi:threonine dehydratase
VSGETTVPAARSRGPLGSVYEPPTLAEIEAAERRIASTVLRTPLVPLQVENVPAEIFLKLENLQPIGSFKLRGAANAVALVDRDELADGVWTASAGNMAQAVAWLARERRVPCTVVVPETAPKTKLEAIARLGADTVPVPVATWLEVFRTRTYPGMRGVFVHPFSDPNVVAGNGTIGLEIAADLADVNAVVVPYGGGGLCCGIASALRELVPSATVYACEVETAAPLAASLAAGEPAEVDHTPSFVDGIGAPRVFGEMFALARQLVDASLVVGLTEVAAAIRLLVERVRVVVEGAGAAPVAAALSGRAGTGKIVCVVSGGNLDTSVLTAILAGKAP